jgi:hypothetical protein
VELTGGFKTRLCHTSAAREGDGMPLSPEQRQRVLDSIEFGHLRLDALSKMYAGYGTGRTCSGCKDTIGPEDVEYEADFADGGRYRFHLGCAGLWHAVQLRRERPQKS